MNCINNKCKHYYEGDTYCNVCDLANKVIFSDNKCVGIDYIKPAMEKLGCQIGELLNKYHELEDLESYIKSKQ